MNKVIIVFATALFLAAGCNQEKGQQRASEKKPSVVEISDPLPSWNEGKSKDQIIAFVDEVTDSSSSNFIPIRDRIATFDNDGTLWSEKPLYFQLLYVMDKVREMAADHPEWKNTQPYQAVLENDLEALASTGMGGVMTLLMTTHAGMSTAEFETSVSQWINSATHPKTGKHYNEMTYQPMLELLEYLRAKDFKTFIVSGGGIEFMRPWVEETYGIPRDQVVGSSIKTEYVYEDGVGKIMRRAEIDFIDDKEGKPDGIWRFIGRKPVFAGGNSDGDLQMLQFTKSTEPAFALFIHHTDSTREWAYDRQSHVGQFDKGLDEAREKGWTIVDMAMDWKVIYPFEME